MKKIFLLSILFSTILLSCTKEPEPEPEEIRTYCFLYHFIQEFGSVIWEVADNEIPYEQVFGAQFPGSIVLETTAEEIVFTVKHPGTKQELISQAFQVEKNKYYSVFVHGSADDPALFIREIDTSHPQSGQVKFQLLHSIPAQNSVDLYMGGASADNKVVSNLAYLSLTEHFEVSDNDARTAITLSAYSPEYNQDSVLLTSIYNNEILTGANYLFVAAPSTYDPLSELTMWVYDLPLD